MLILWEEVETVIRTLKFGKAAEIDNIPVEFLKHNGDTVVDVLIIICNKIWQTGE